jgi:hypothetical protein
MIPTIMSRDVNPERMDLACDVIISRNHVWWSYKGVLNCLLVLTISLPHWLNHSFISASSFSTMTKNLTVVVYKPDSQSTDEYFVYVDPLQVCCYTSSSPRSLWILAMTVSQMERWRWVLLFLLNLSVNSRLICRHVNLVHKFLSNTITYLWLVQSPW